jgi:hypothetical protein
VPPVLPIRLIFKICLLIKENAQFLEGGFGISINNGTPLAFTEYT